VNPIDRAFDDHRQLVECRENADAVSSEGSERVGR
jgi:hypothetical protein